MALLISVLLAVFVIEDDILDWVVVLAGAVIEVGETAFFFWWSKRRRAAVGVETLVGRRAVVAADCRPRGQVRVAGELWQARCGGGASAGDEVVVRAVDGLTLEVERA